MSKIRIRTGLEAGWTWGPFALTGEYIHLTYSDLKPSGEDPKDADFSSWYISGFCSLTGEPIVVNNGVMEPLYPEKFFNPAEGTFGAVVLAARAEHFTGDADWIKQDAFVSVRDADAYSVAVNWILYPMHRIIFDYTCTNFTDPIRVMVNPDGSVSYTDKESVFTIRLSMDF